MNFHARNGRCAVDFRRLGLPVPGDRALEILRRLGFREETVDIVTLARERIGLTSYRRGASPNKAPNVVDCSSFTQWLFGQCGIELPRRSIQQRECGRALAVDDIRRGDLVFTTSGYRNYYWNDPADGVGHVAIATGDDTVVHARNSAKGVTESSLDCLTERHRFRGARRLVEDWVSLVTLVIPADREIISSDDIRWIVLQSL